MHQGWAAGHWRRGVPALAPPPSPEERQDRGARGHGLSPLALLQGVRLQRAQPDRGTRMTIAQVAEAVGYEDATALRRLMQRRAGACPSRLRPRKAA